MLKVAVGNETVSWTVVFSWYRHIKRGEDFWEGDIVLVVHVHHW